MNSLIDFPLNASQFVVRHRRPVNPTHAALCLTVAVVVLVLATIVVADGVGVSLAPSRAFTAAQFPGSL